MGKKIFYTFLIFLITANIVNGQKNIYRINGMVKDSDSNEKLPYANISIFDTLNYNVSNTQTNLNGEYKILDLKSGKYSLISKYVGYKADTLRFEIKENALELELPIIKLKLEAANLKEVTVKAKKPYIVQERDKIALNVSESVMANSGNVIDLLRNAPMIRLDNKGNITLNGKNAVIYVDGKMANAKGESLEVILMSMPSQSIEIIELISNPGSKYEASGTAVVNIRTIKSKNIGMNGSINSGIGQGENSRANTGFSIYYRNKKLNIFSSLNYQNIGRYYRTTNLREIKPAINFDDYEDDLRRNHLLNYRLGLDYELSKKTTFGILLNGDNNSRSRTVEAYTKFGNTAKTDSLQEISSFGIANFGNSNINLNLKHKFNKNLELVNDIDFGTFFVDWQEDIENTFIKNDNIINQLTLRTPWIQNVNVASMKSDLKYVIAKYGTVEAGGQIRQTNTVIDFVFEEKANNVWKQKSNFNSNYNYDENVAAFYLTFASNQSKKFNYQTGIRGENTQAQGKERLTNEIVNQNYFNFFPSASMQYNPSDTNQFSLSYTKRINRPQYGQLNSRYIFKSLYFFSQGNVDLKPSYSNSFEFTYTYTPLLTINLGYTFIKNNIAIFPKIIENTTIYQARNFDNSETFSLNLTFNKQINKWFYTNTSIKGLFVNNKINGDEENNGYSAYFFSQNYFNVFKSSKVDITAYYQPMIPSGILVVRPWKTVDIGISKSIFQKKIDARLWLSDVFNSNIQRYSINNELLNLYETFKIESRVIQLSLNYKFGNKNIKFKDRKTGLEQESKRILTGK